METIWLQFSEETKTAADGWSSWQQPIESFPYQEEVELSDPRYIAYYDSLPGWAQAYAPSPVRD